MAEEFAFVAEGSIEAALAEPRRLHEIHDTSRFEPLVPEHAHGAIERCIGIEFQWARQLVGPTQVSVRYPYWL